MCTLCSDRFINKKTKFFWTFNKIYGSSSEVVFKVKQRFIFTIHYQKRIFINHMGQKVHPTGFRIGINKPYKSRWFADYTIFSELLKEDYRIRQFFEEVWGVEWCNIYKKAGIITLEIRRKFDKVELLFHAFRPKQIMLQCDRRPIVSILKAKLGIIRRKVQLKVIKVIRGTNVSIPIAKTLAAQLERRVAVRRAMQAASSALQRMNMDGFKIQISGRLNGVEMARKESLHFGRVPLQTIDADIGYTAYRALTMSGILGIKIWVFQSRSPAH